MNQIEKDMAYMISSGQWWLNEKWFFGVFPLIALIIAVAVSVNKKMDLEQFFVVSIFSWIGICLVGLFLYHTTWYEMKIHFANWCDALALPDDDMPLKRAASWYLYWTSCGLISIIFGYLCYADCKPKKPKV